VLAIAGVSAGLFITSRGAPVPAIEADRFVGSTAVATHWRFGNIYQNYDALSEKLIDSGIRHLRDADTDPDFIARVQKLSDAGVKSILTLHPAGGTRPNSSYWAVAPGLAIDDYVRAVGRDVIAYAEMNNERRRTRPVPNRSRIQSLRPLRGQPPSPALSRANSISGTAPLDSYRRTRKPAPRGLRWSGPPLPSLRRAAFWATLSKSEIGARSDSR
jgi:hypothetical protein